MKLDPAKTLVTAGVLALGLSGGIATAAYAPDITTSVASVFNNIGTNAADNGPHGADYFTAAATYIGITVDQLRTELGTDKSLADVAVAHGKTRDGLIQALMTAEQANISTLVDQKGTGAQRGPGGPGFGVPLDSLAAAATYLGISQTDLQTKVQAGQTAAPTPAARAPQPTSDLKTPTTGDVDSPRPRGPRAPPP